jgi:2-polyprenyl-3-methyl-5-hydroxy-6-metoxy-1,4-benzoquinol methylase
MSDDRFYREKDSNYFRHARLEVLDLLPAGFKSIVDVGGSSGATLSAIKERWPKVRTICIDAHEESVIMARRNGHEAFACDLDKSSPDVFRTVDVVMFLDVLEHLADPWRRLADIVDQLPRGAHVIVSLPNVRFWEASCRLFFLGDWKLQEAGVMDRTHLRFFTRRTAEELLKGAGLHVRDTRSRLPGGRRYRLMNALSLGLVKDFLTEQYLFIAEKPQIKA